MSPLDFLKLLPVIALLFLLHPGELDVKEDRDGVFLSGPEEVQSKRRCSQLRKRFPNAVAIEVEGEGNS